MHLQPAKFLAYVLSCSIALAIGDRVSGGAESRPPPLNIGTQRELFADWELIGQLKGNAALRLHHPEPQELSRTHFTWDSGAHFGVASTFVDNGLYRRYYRPGPPTVNPISDEQPVLCYEESDDGIEWRQPELGFFGFRGTKKNNVVFVGGHIGPLNVSPEATVFKDRNPAASVDARYKAIFWSIAPKGFLPFKSPDGWHWAPMTDAPLKLKGGASINQAYWDELRGEYRIYYRYHVKTNPNASVEAEAKGFDPPKGFVRSIRTATSKDLINWSEPTDLRFVDSPSEELYTNATMPYYRAPHLYIGFPTRYLSRGWSPSLRALPDSENRTARSQLEPRFGTAITEGVFMISRDGVTFKRWNEAFLRPGPERSGTWAYGDDFIAWHPVETKSKLPGAPNELSFYAEEGKWIEGGRRSVRRYTLRLDGFVSVEAPMSGGEVITSPIQFDGKQLTLNFSTSAAGDVKVEIQDLSGSPLPGFALKECAPLFGDAIDRVVSWAHGRDTAAAAGKPVRLRFVLHDADVFAFQFEK